MIPRALSIAIAVLLCRSFALADGIAPTVIPAHQVAAKEAAVMRDERAPGGKAVVYLFPRTEHRSHDVIRGSTAALPPGDYIVTAWIEFVPVSTQNLAMATLIAGAASREVTAAHFDTSGYTPIAFRLLHGGGPIPFSISASTDNSSNGIRPGQSEDEKTYATAKPKIKDIDGRKPEGDIEKLDIEATGDIAALKFDDIRIACSKIEFKAVRLSNVLVKSVDVDKVHYLPGETVNARCTLQCPSTQPAGPLKLIAQLVNEVDQTRQVFERDMRLDSSNPQTISFSFKLDDVTEFGHELRCTLLRSGQPVHSNNQVFGVSKNVYRIGITGSAGPQDRSHLTPEDAENIAKANKNAYANYFECFAWAPCDFCNMTPKTDEFFSGQTQYHGSVHGFKNMIFAAHKYGIKAISYAKEAACAIDGANMYLRHPSWFGGGSPEFDSFYLERMYHNEYIMDLGDNQVVKWQHWANWWVNDAEPAALDFGCDEIVRSAKMLGWDGIRWDGHYVDHMDYFNKRLLKQIPDFTLGYNVAFASPGAPVFLPTQPASDFHQIARNHGMIMDESIREWSMGSGEVRPYYTAICREADYEKRIGGLPLFIEFDRATRQDAIYNVLWGLAGGQRYTYGNTVGEFNAGLLTRFLTRYSAFIWDDTARIKNAERWVSLTVSPDQIPQRTAEAPKARGRVAVPSVSSPPGPWFDQSTWLRKLPDGRQQLLVDIVNPPGYAAFCNRVQVPPVTLHNVGVKARLPAGARLLRAFSVSVDDVDGLTQLEAKTDAGDASVVVPQLRFWAIVVFEIGPSSAQPLAYPAYELTTPVEDAAKYLADQEKQKAIEAEQVARAQASGVNLKPTEPPKRWYADFTHSINIDLETESKVVKPASLALMRNGLLDVVHIKGMYAWMNPIEDAIGLAGGGNLRNTYANHLSFRIGPQGCLENFPETYRELLSQDVVILDNSLASDVGARQRVMIADFVRNGGGLIVLSGCNSISCGTDHNCYIEEMLPVTISGRRNTVGDDKGFHFTIARNDVFSSSIDWSKIQAFSVDTSAVKPDAQVIAKVGDKPAIVVGDYGKGRVICFLMNMEGDYSDSAKPYWQSAQWPQILADAIKWAAADYKSVSKAAPVKHVVDPNKTVAMDLLLNAEGMSATVFSKKLLEARDNVEDSASASALIQAATENWGKLTDKEMFGDIVDDVEPYIDDSFAPLAEKITALSLDDFRVAGFTLLRHCSSPNSRPLLEKALREQNPLIVREALAALAHAKDPASIPAIHDYLAKGGKEHLLAYTALRMMGDNVNFDTAPGEYIVAYKRATALTALRKSLFENLHSGTSFKLTLSERKAYERKFARSKNTEKNAVFDVNQFRSTLTKFTDAQFEQFTAFVVNAEDRAAASMAFAALPNFTPEQATKFRAAMGKAKLPQLQMLAAP
jgi:uncharacterized membrane protein